MTRAVAALAPAAAAFHLRFGGAVWADRLPSLGLAYPPTCTGTPHAPPALKAAYLAEWCAQGLVAQSVYALVLLAALVPLHGVLRLGHARRGRAGRGSPAVVALTTIVITSASFSAWMLHAMLVLSSRF